MAATASIAKETSAFRLETESPEVWKNILGALQVIVEEATISIDSDGLTCRAMDPSHVCLIDVNVPSSEFKAFSCSKPDRFAFRVADLLKMVSRARAKDPVVLERPGGEMLTVALGKARRFELHLMNGGKSTDLPKIAHTASFELPKERLDSVVADLVILTDKMRIDATADGAIFSGKGDNGSGKIEVPQGEFALFGGKLEVKQEASTLYSTEYLQKIAKAVEVEKLVVNFSSKMPVRIDFKLGEKGCLSFWQAPRVE